MQGIPLWVFILSRRQDYSFLLKLKAREGGCFLIAVVAQPVSVRDNGGKCNEATGKQARTITAFY